VLENHPIEIKFDLNQALDSYNLFRAYQQKRIMVVDDEEFCISSMRAVLFSAGINVDYQVEFCITGKEAFEQLQKAYANGMQYMIIFTDFQMPIMNGIESTIKMRKYLRSELKISRENQPKIIGVTGHVMDSF
jgi:CheY-like chemotaxis protein